MEPSVLLKAFPLPREMQLPLRFTMPLKGRLLGFELAYNDFAHLFTMTISRERGEELVTGALVYGMDFCQPFQHIEELRGVKIVPFDMALRHDALTLENLGQDVQIYYSEP